MEFIQLLNAGNHLISMWIYDLWGIFKQNGFFGNNPFCLNYLNYSATMPASFSALVIAMSA